MARTRTGSNRRTMDKYDTGVDLAALGRALLLTYEGWWDVSTYSGAGNLLNLGTGGSGADFFFPGGTQNPTFAAGALTFDGVNDLLVATATAGMQLPAAGNAFTVGVILSLPNPHANNGAVISKGVSGTSAFWYLTEGGTNPTNGINGVGSTATPASSTLPASPGAMVAGTKYLYTFSVNASRVGSNQLDNGTPAVGAAMSGAGAVTNTAFVVLGATSASTLFASMTLFGAFITPAVISNADRTLIGAYYGKNI